MPYAVKRRGKIRNLRWRPIGFSFAAQAAGSAAVQALASSDFPDTVMRTRGSLLVYLDGVQTPGVLVRWALGFVCVPEGSGSTVIWSPLTDANAPWFVYESGYVGYEESVTDVVQVAGLSLMRRTINSKAMRKCPPDMELQAVFEQSTELAAGNVNVAFWGRVLLGR